MAHTPLAANVTTTVSDIDSESSTRPEHSSARAWAIIQSRLATIERLLASASEGLIDDEQMREARRAAHNLAGSLDILGLTRAGAIAGQLERFFEAGDLEGSGWELATELRRELERGLAKPPSGDSDEAVPAESRLASILVVDDDEIMAKMIASALQRQGHRVFRARNGAEAVAMTARRRFDLILLDLQMPVMDGFAACQALRRDSHLADVPIVLITAQSNEQRVRERVVEGASDYLIKPFTVSELRTRVRIWLLGSPKGSSA